MNRVNFQKELDRKIAELSETGAVPSLLLHCCCAPCSSYVLEYLAEHFHITAFFFNPNITPEAEYTKRMDELKRLISEQPHRYPVRFIEGGYDPMKFFDIAAGLETAPEGGERCHRCYRLRLAETADTAKAGGFDFFTTTLSISPLKDAEKLNGIGGEEAARTGVPYLFSDFKKREGYKRSIVLSAQYGLYRQNYCGCVYSRRNREDNLPADKLPIINNETEEQS